MDYRDILISRISELENDIESKVEEKIKIKKLLDGLEKTEVKENAESKMQLLNE